MKTFKKVTSFIFTVVLVMGTTINANAAENFFTSNNYVPNEEFNTDMSDITGIELQNGEKIVVGDYTIEYQEDSVCVNSDTRSTTKNYVSTSHYTITNNGTQQEWYTVEQTTNYTYNGKTVKINASSCNLNVKTYYPECSYTINKNTVDNSSSANPTYTIGLTMQLPSQSLTIIDVVTVHADGTYTKTHKQ